VFGAFGPRVLRVRANSHCSRARGTWSRLAYDQAIRNTEPERNLSEGRLLKGNSELSPSFYIHFFISLFLVRHTLHTKACHSKLPDKDSFSRANIADLVYNTVLQMSCKTHAASLIITQTRSLLWAESLPNNIPTEIYLLPTQPNYCIPRASPVFSRVSH
jgi:hypothetical protein